VEILVDFHFSLQSRIQLNVLDLFSEIRGLSTCLVFQFYDFVRKLNWIETCLLLPAAE